MCRYWIAPAIEPPGWRAMNQATVLRNWLVLKIVGIEVAFVFPPLNALFALVGTIALGLLIMRIPLRRAVRLRPGDAIRYS